MSIYTVTLREGNHPTQPWTVEIQPPRRTEAYKMRQRYANEHSAKRGANRNLAKRATESKNGDVIEVPIMFVIKHKKK